VSDYEKYSKKAEVTLTTHSHEGLVLRGVGFAILALAEAIREHGKTAEKSLETTLSAPEKTEHVCGLQGFDPMRGDTCPACEEFAKKPSYNHLLNPTTS